MRRGYRPSSWSMNILELTQIESAMYEPSLIARFNTTLGLLERASIKSSKRNEPGSKDLSPTSGICVSAESSSCSPRGVREILEPLRIFSPDVQDLWRFRCEERHAQEMLFADNTLQLSFDFDIDTL